ncbi:MAG: glycosyltransferase family 1 protein [Gemmataceae bacterium]|nr:glycosyltransferase family 1 protein [Gemmataceae bacterium]
MGANAIRVFTVVPQVPPRLKALLKLAYNLWWCWNPHALDLFRRVDPDGFDAVSHSPVRLLNTLSKKRMDGLLQDEGFLNQLDRVEVEFDRYQSASSWFQENVEKSLQGIRIAYFSMEFGIHDSVPVYSGGLGVLAGDHLKAASDLGLPLTAVGLMYREGYFRQYLNVDGWQQERYPENDFFNLPVTEVMNSAGETLVLSLEFPGREVFFKVWRLQVGRVALYLLDTNILKNQAEDRAITARLYGGDTDLRIRQEILLGMGGVRVLHALKLDPQVCHMNEGHSAFSGLERIRLFMQQHSIGFAQAREAVAGGTVFTTHTPVPAGNDRFPPAQIEHYFSGVAEQLGLSKKDFLGLGRENPDDTNEPFCMTILAVRLANVSNGVSKLHGEVSRKMWKNLFHGIPEKEIPITSITNGIHTQTWVSAELNHLWDRYLGASWPEKIPDPATWKKIDAIPDAELWRTHERQRERLVVFARKKLKEQLKSRGASPGEIARAEEILDPEALTIGFARRFATYKRGSLIFRNLERLAALMSDKSRPLQILYAGKAHPQDHGGKELIAEIAHFARRAEFRHRVVFLEDYDMNITRFMVQGVDVWLNNPRRPLEASGTSGMKVAVNGGLNLSILDGWWCEGYDGENGWAIGAGEEYSDLGYQDEVESRAIYDLLEEEIIPLFYQRGPDGLPRGWLKRMKNSITTLAPVFSTSRMVEEYATRCYIPSSVRFLRLAENHFQQAGELAQWRNKVSDNWAHIRVEDLTGLNHAPFFVGGALKVEARVHLGGLAVSDVEVQVFHGPLDSHLEIHQFQTTRMKPVEKKEEGVWLFGGKIGCDSSGRQGYLIRVLPSHQNLANPFEPGKVYWC